MVLLGRTIVLLLLTAIGASAFLGIAGLVRSLLVTSFQVRPFQVLSASAGKNDGELLARLLVARMRDVEDVLTFDLKTGPAPAAAVVENLSENLRSHPAPQVKDVPDIELKIAEVDLAGIIQGTLQLFHKGPTLEGFLLSSGKATELTVRYEENGYEQDWVQALDSGVESALGNLADTVVLALRKRDTPGFQGMDTTEFSRYIKGLREYHIYLQSFAGKEEGGGAATHLGKAIEEWSAVAQTTTSPRPLIYLASAYALASRYSEADAALKRAQSADANDPLVRGKESALRLAIANGMVPPLATERQSPAAVKSFVDQPFAELIQLREALVAARNGKPVTIAVLATGYAGVRSDRVEEGVSFVTDETVRDDARDYGSKVVNLVLSLAPMARVIPVKVMSKVGVGTTAEILQGLNYVAQQKPQIVLASYGSPAQDPAQERAFSALEASGTFTVAPAGNNSDSALQMPASLPSVLSVASTDPRGDLSFFTTYGNWVKLAAPGEHISLPDGDQKLVEIGQGTSFAAAVVAGVAALVLSVNPDLSPAGLRKLLTDTATKLPPDAKGHMLGGGIINARAAVLRAMDK